MGQGAYISGIAHAALILWALVGGLFLRGDEALPIATMDVSVLTPEEFDQLFAAEQPEPAPIPEPEPEAEPQPEPAPQPEPVPDPEPVVEPEQTPQPPAPEPVISEPDLPVSETPTPQQADIISTEVTPAPEPEAAPLPDLATQTAPDEQASPDTTQADAAAPEATTTEIVTEAETPSTAAPTRSMLPAARPTFEVAEVEPEPSPEPEPAPEPAPEPDPIAEALAQATAEAQTPTPNPTPRGPPLSLGEKDALRVSVQRCWNVGSLSSEALRTTVTVFVAMQPDGKPVTGSLRMVDFEGGSQAAATKAYEAARRAIIRCGSSGFDLPREKYSQWAEIEMIFNPEQMRIK